MRDPIVKAAITPMSTLRRLIASIVYRGSGAPDSGAPRYAAIIRGVIAAFLSRGIGALTSLAAVPLTIGYLGPERYGVWIMVNTLIAWLMIADLGLGNNLVNAVAAAHGRRSADLARRQISNTFALLVAVSLLALALTLPLAWALDIPDLLNIASAQARAEILPAIVLTLLIFFLSFPFTLVRKVLEATQEGDRAYAWSGAGSVMSLLGLLAVTQFHGGLPWLVIAVLGGQGLTAVASAIWLCGFYRPELRPRYADIEVASLATHFRNGGLFFIIQILALLNLSSDTFIIARVLGPSQVTPYSVTAQLFSYATLLQLLAFPLVWSGLAAAYSRGDWAWMRRTYAGFIGMSLASAALVAVPLALLAPEIIRLWAGEAAVPPPSFVAWSVGWSLLLAVMNSNACLLNSQGRLYGQIIYGGLTAVVNIGLSIWLAPTYGIAGVIAATVIAYLICALVPSQVEVLIVFRRAYANNRI